MSDTALPFIIQYGTQAQRIAFVPNPPAGIKTLYLWYVTDSEPDLYAWNGTTWQWINPPVIGGITQITGDATAGPGTGSQALTLANSGVVAGAYTFASITVDAKGRVTVASSGTAPAAPTGWVLLEEHIAAAAASVDFVTRNAPGKSGASFQSDFDVYRITVSGMRSSINSVNPWLRFSTNGGVSYDSSAIYSYEYLVSTAGGGAIAGGAAQGQILLSNTNNCPNDANSGYTGWVEIYNPLGAVWTNILTYMKFRGDSTTRAYIQTGGSYEATTAVNALRFILSSGLITGTFRLYGLSK